MAVLIMGARGGLYIGRIGSLCPKRGGGSRASPSYVRGVLATAHDTESHQPPATDHRQRPEDPRRREAAGVREHGCGRCRSGRRGRRTRAGRSRRTRARRSGRARGSRGAGGGTGHRVVVYSAVVHPSVIEALIIGPSEIHTLIVEAPVVG